MAPQPGGSAKTKTNAGARLPSAALGLVRSHYAQLPGALQRVAETVLLDPPAVAEGTIVELAERSGTSVSTVSRFCRAIGFGGFAGLRLGLRDSGSTGGVRDGVAAAVTDPLERMLQQIVADDMIAVRDTAALIDLSEVARAADMICRAQRVEIYAAAGSAAVGEQLRESLARLGGESGSRLGRESGSQPSRESGSRRGGGAYVALGISCSGHTRDTVDRLARARARGAKTIALTSFPRSPLAELADILLLTTALQQQALSARHPQLVVLELLRAAVARLIQQRHQGAR